MPLRPPYDGIPAVPFPAFQEATQSAFSTQTTAAVGTFAAMTNGPSITIGAGTIYEVRHEGSMASQVAALVDGRVAVAKNGTAQPRLAWMGTAAQFEGTTPSVGQRLTLATGDVLTLQVATNNTSVVFGGAVLWRLTAIPVGT